MASVNPNAPVWILIVAVIVGFGSLSVHAGQTKMWRMTDKPFSPCEPKQSRHNAFKEVQILQGVAQKLARMTGQVTKCRVEKRPDGAILDCGSGASIKYYFDSHKACKKMEATLVK
ncbi:hypothetical protein WDW86_10290 [Bdellovibrionota bacterium FG-2]